MCIEWLAGMPWHSLTIVTEWARIEEWRRTKRTQPASQPEKALSVITAQQKAAILWLVSDPHGPQWPHATIVNRVRELYYYTNHKHSYNNIHYTHIYGRNIIALAHWLCLVVAAITAELFNNHNKWILALGLILISETQLIFQVRGGREVGKGGPEIIALSYAITKDAFYSISFKLWSIIRLWCEWVGKRTE